jgi:hypothetical protein
MPGSGDCQELQPIIGWDHNRGEVERVALSVRKPERAKRVDIGTHG